jgi:hypothetical protein
MQHFRKLQLHAILGALLFHALFQHVVARKNFTRSLVLFEDARESKQKEIRASGFNTLLLHRIQVTSEGNLTYVSNYEGMRDTVVVKDGVYAGGRSLQSAMYYWKNARDSTIKRVEISMQLDNNLSEMMKKSGPVDDRIVRNFAVLKDQWQLDAVNIVDGGDRATENLAKFGKMLVELGYKITFSPMTETVHWKSVRDELTSGLENKDQVPDKVYLQCYGSGLRNTPRLWSVVFRNIIPVVRAANKQKQKQGTLPVQLQYKFDEWKAYPRVRGGGIWNSLDIEDSGVTYRAYGKALQRLFP